MRMLPILLASLAALLGCGGGGSSPVPTGTLAVSLGSDSIPGFQSVEVSLGKLEGTMDGAHWTTLFDAIGGTSAGVSVDLQALQSGHAQVVLPATQVPAGTYTQFRATWGSRNYADITKIAAYVVTSGGTPQVLAMPASTLFSGSAVVPANGSARFLLMVGGQQAVLSRAGSSSTTYTFNASGGVYDQGACGRITGTLSGGSGLAGAEVFAQTVDGLGQATVQRRALADASGAFVLDGLAAGPVYYVACAPAGFQAAAGGPFTLAQGGTSAASLTFTPAAATGSLNLAITPPSTSSQATWGELRQSLAAGGTSQNLVVRSLTAGTSAQQDSFAFAALAPGVYGVTAQRATGGQTPVLNPGAQYSVTAGSTQSAALTF